MVITDDLPWQPIAEYPWPEDRYECYGPKVFLAWPYSDGTWGFGSGVGFQWIEDGEPPVLSFTSGDFNVEPTHFFQFTPPKKEDT